MTGARLAVVCGTAQCRAVLMIEGQRFDVRGDGAPEVGGLAASARAISTILSRLAQVATLDVEDLFNIDGYLAVAGIDDAVQGLALEQLLPLNRICIEGPQRAAIQGALANGEGIVAVVDEGSFVGRHRNSELYYMGGYGLTLGDEASGAWLGREACALSLRATEGVGPASPALLRLRHELGGRAGVLAFANRAEPRDFTALAPLIVAEAEEADAGAAMLMLRGAAYLAQAFDALSWSEGVPLCLTGGFGVAYARWLEPRFRSGLVMPEGDAMDGALRLAGQVAQGWRP